MEKIARWVDIHERPRSAEYWRTRSLQERFAAIEELRLHYIKLKNVEPGFQRVCRVVERTPR